MSSWKVTSKSIKKVLKSNPDLNIFASALYVTGEFAFHHTCARQGINGLPIADSPLFSITCLYAFPNISPFSFLCI